MSELDPATRARLMCGGRESADISALLTALDAAVAERDDAERAIAEQWRPMVAALEAERDAARADLQRIADRLCQEDEAFAAQRDAYAAVVRAARACYRGEGPQAYTALLAAVAALPEGASSPSPAADPG